MRDYSLLIQNACKRIGPEEEDRIFIGIDECFNREEIKQLVTGLVDRELARSSAPLWWQQRIRSDGSSVYASGGISLDSETQRVLLDGDIGKPLKHQSYDDLQIVDYLLVHFLSFGRLVLLSENVKNNVGGLRRILNERVQPILAQRHGRKLSLVSLYKKGKTDINDYCSKVAEFVERKEFEYGYSQLFI